MPQDKGLPKMTSTQVVGLTLLVAAFAEMLVSMLLLTMWHTDSGKSVFILFFAVRLPLVVLSFLTLTVYHSLNRMELERRLREHEEQETRLQLEQSLQLLEGLRAQRHDFRNRLQVLEAMAALGKEEQLLHYLDSCRMALNEVASLSRIEDAALQALFLVAQSKARELGIKFEVDCQVDLKNLRYSSLKISRIFSGLLETAVESAARQKQSPTVSVAMWQDEHGYQCVFWHNGPPLPSGDRERVFAPAMEKDTGLHIVETLLEELGGQVTVCTNEGEGVEYRVWLPAITRDPRATTSSDPFSARNSPDSLDWKRPGPSGRGYSGRS